MSQIGRRTQAWVVALHLIACAQARSDAERLPVRVLTTAEGLPRDQLSCVVSDDRGFLWFCTAEGLARFDGHQTTTYGRNDGLQPPAVRSFLKARDGRYWVGANAGLFEFTPSQDGRSRFRAIPRSDGIPTGPVNAVVESRDHSIWCASGHGLLHVTHTSAGVDLREVDIGLPRATENDQIVRTVFEDDRGELWVGAGSGLYRRGRDGRTTRITTKHGLPVNEVWAVLVDPDGLVWAATRVGLCLIDRDRMTSGQSLPGTPPREINQHVVRRVFGSRDGLPTDNIKALLRVDHVLWVGTVRGFSETSLAPDGRLIIRRSLTGFYTWALTSDLHGNVWAATEAGARQLSEGGFTTFTRDDGLPASRVWSITESHAGEICATTLDERVALSCFDGHKFISIPIAATRSIRDTGWGWSQLTLQDRRGRWWIPTGEGLLQYAAGPVRSLASSNPVAIYDSRRGLGANSIFRVFEDTHGWIWVATFAEEGNAIARIDPESFRVQLFDHTDGVPRDLPIVHAFVEDRNGNVWIGLEKGLLLRYRAGRFTQVVIHPSDTAASSAQNSSEYLRALAVDRAGRLWIASTESGLGRIDDPGAPVPHVTWYSTSQGLSSDTVWTLVEDSSGGIMLGTGRGVDRFDPGSGTVTHYSAADGFPRGEIFGAFRDRRGAVWFATTDGASRLEPRPPVPSQPPLTFVTAVRVGGLAVPLRADGEVDVAPVTVPPGDRRVEIEFVSPSAREADGLRYQHQLQGIDRSWTTTDARVVAIAGAAPGTYRFLVRATLANGTVGPPAQVALTIIPPVWQRWWFLTSGTIILFLGALAGHRRRMDRAVQLERIRTRIATDLHDDVGASLSQVAILGEVVGQRAAIDAPDTIRGYGHKIAAISREVADSLSDIVWAINPEKKRLGDLVQRMRQFAGEMLISRDIAFDLETSSFDENVHIDDDVRRHLFLIFKELVHNTVRHSGCARVRITLGAARHAVELRLTDDGKGFRVGVKKGHGLDNMRRRVEAVGGSVVVESAPGKGTTVTARLPLHGRSRGYPP